MQPVLSGFGKLFVHPYTGPGHIKTPPPITYPGVRYLPDAQ